MQINLQKYSRTRIELREKDEEKMHKNTNYASIFDFFTAKSCKFEKFVVTLQPDLGNNTNYIL